MAPALLRSPPLQQQSAKRPFGCTKLPDEAVKQSRQLLPLNFKNPSCGCTASLILSQQETRVKERQTWGFVLCLSSSQQISSSADTWHLRGRRGKKLQQKDRTSRNTTNHTTAEDLSHPGIPQSPGTASNYSHGRHPLRLVSLSLLCCRGRLVRWSAKSEV